jgi:hypothetical protein
VLPGSLTAAIDVKAGDIVTATFAGLGNVSPHTSGRSPPRERPQEQADGRDRRPGNIGTDLLVKLLHSDLMTCSRRDGVP